MNLAGPPIAKYERVNPYEGMIEENYCAIQSLKKLSANSTVYLLELSPPTGKFGYLGCRNISQLAQYFILTINDKKTRLYTSVNCLNTTNRALMASIDAEMKENLVNYMKYEENNGGQSGV